jgi:hypothetical protein
MKTRTFCTTEVQYASAQKQREPNKLDHLQKFSRFYLCSFIVSDENYTGFCSVIKITEIRTETIN